MTPKQTPKDIVTATQQEYKKHFRITIFGSARIKEGDRTYKKIYNLSKDIGKHHFDIITGGGPGLMDAANAGHMAGSLNNKSKSIGLLIKLPYEQSSNSHLDIKQSFDRFSQRLDTFMVLSHVVVVAAGGIGTCLELFYTWQLTQVKHICSIPIILYDSMWNELLEWVKKYPLQRKYIENFDLHNIIVCKTHKEVMQRIMQFHNIYEKEGENFCLNYKKYDIR